MDLITEGRNFRLVLESELPKILNILKGYLSESLKLYETINIHMTDRIWDFYFYVSKEWPQKPILIQSPGCTLTPDGNIYQSLSIFCPTSHLECVDLVLTEDILINRNKPMNLHFTHTTILERLNDFYKNIGAMQSILCDILILKGLRVNLDLDEFPNDEAEIRPLTVDDVQLIHDHYPAKEIESIELFKILVQKLPAVGVFDKRTNELAAWMLCSYYGDVFDANTSKISEKRVMLFIDRFNPFLNHKLESKNKHYTRYGLQVAKALTKLAIEYDYVPYVAVLPHNAASQNLYLKLGFKLEYQMSRVKMTPHST